MKFIALDTCPCPEEIYDVLVAIKKLAAEHGEPIIFTSIYRGDDKNAAGIIKRYGKATQAWLYKAYWILHLPGYNPANRPKQSTHECFNDGVAYPGPAGRPLFGYQVGMDSNSAANFVKYAAMLGFHAVVTYPTSSREKQHANFMKKPKLNLFKSLKRGQTSLRVKSIRKNLEYVRDPESQKTYLSPADRPKNLRFFDESLYHALREFQRDHHQKDDGIYGLQTARQLAVSVRFRKKQDAKKK